MRYLFLRITVLFFAFIISNFSSAQYITTVIGNGTSACYLNDQPPLCIPSGYPQGVCVAPSGNMYFTCGNAIKKLAASTGIVTRIAGSDSYGSTGDGGPAINALFQFTTSVKIDKQGDLYVAEYSGHRIRKINMVTGIVTTVVGNSNAGYSGDGGPAINASIHTPKDLAIDDAGNIYIADFSNNRIRKVDAATGIISTFAGIGTPSYSGDGGLAANAGIPYPNSICLDIKGNLYISETYSGISCRIRKVDAATGIITTIAGNNNYAYSGDGGLAINASLFSSTAVLVDTSGNVFISEYDDSRIRKIDIATGIIYTVAGNGLNGFGGDDGIAVNATLKSPLGLAFDNAGDLLICDNQNHRIRKLYTNAVAPPTGSPNISIAAPSTVVCSGASITFTATTGYTVSGSYYVWTKNGSVVGTDSTQWTGTGLQAGDVIMCTLPYPVCGGTTKVQSNSITLTGNFSQPLTVSIAVSKTTICKNENIVFNATAVNASSQPAYQWKLNQSNVGSNVATYSTATLANGDVISCEITVAPSLPCSAGGAASSNEITMNVNSSILPLVNITASADKICAGKPVTFQVNVQNGATSLLFQWKLNGTNTGTNNNQYTSSNLADNDEVYCVVNATIGCAAQVSSNAIKLSVESVPLIKLFPLDTVVNKGSQVQLQAIVNGPFAAYTWTPLTGLNNANTLTPVTIPLLQNGVFRFKIVTAHNCVDSLSAVIKVQQKLFMPGAFTPNNDNLNEVYRIPPNTSIQLKNFSIYNRWGEKIFSTTNINAGWDGAVNKSNQNAGAYIYIITGSDKNGAFSLRGKFLLVR